VDVGSIEQFRKQQRALGSQGRVWRRLLAAIALLIGAVSLVVILGIAILKPVPEVLNAIMTRLYQDPAPCVIKGEIRFTNERVYYLPGNRAYDRVTISTRRGERWFCSEQEARDAGWRPSRP
jgi:hypothetical protein